MRTTHRPTRTTLLLAALAAASLSLTACGGGDTGAKDAGSATTTGSVAPRTTTAAPAASATPGSGESATGTTDAKGSTDASGSTGGSGTTGGSGGGSATASAAPAAAKGEGAGGTGADAKVPVCVHGDVKVTAAKADEVPTEHIVLTATNTSGRACLLLDHPLIAFGEIQTAKDVPPVAKSRPAAPVVLDPGAPAYANVRVSLGGVHEDNKVVKEFTVNLFAADGPAEGSVVVAAPAGGIAVDEKVAKTGYWTPELRNRADEF
ncbi:DUF4232 domain-containing protein [Streptomyces sp. NPDC014861]|uniref:DUF4232 domain-containing protein n=1 Tax=Streptomyces sp. NPDC014861 TaxID=3364923 RepID=UPI0036F8E907